MCGIYEYRFIKYTERLVEIPNHPYLSSEMQDQDIYSIKIIESQGIVVEWKARGKIFV